VKVLQGLVLLVITTTSLGAFSGRHGYETRQIDLSAKRFSFEPAEITLEKGVPVTLHLKTTDVTHGLVIEELGVKTEIKKGKESSVSFTPEKTGTFTGKCAHFCGAGHGSMTLTVHVVE
jgi:cytochrome c oxidase subunit 2